MSYDFALTQLCAHQVLFEDADYDAARGIVHFTRQPSSANVVLWINGISIPPSGLYNFAELPFSTQEPYRIAHGVNDLIYVGIGQDIPRFIQLLTGPNLKAVDVAQDLQRKLPSLSVTVQNRRVIIKSRTVVNGAAFQFPDPRWTDKTSSSPYTVRTMNAFSYLGINPGRVASGRKLYPGWFITNDPDSPISTDKAIQFTSVFPNASPFVQVSYAVSAGNCPRCFGSKIEFDYNVINGTYERVSDTDLLSQEFGKYLFTKLGSSWKWTWLGSNLVNRIGSKANGSDMSASAMIQVDINQAFRVYQDIKSQQNQRYPFQKISDAEYPYSLDSVSVNTPSDDPTTAVVNIVILSRSRQPVPLQRIIGTPSPFTLIGGNGNFLPVG